MYVCSTFLQFLAISPAERYAICKVEVFLPLSILGEHNYFVEVPGYNDESALNHMYYRNYLTEASQIVVVMNHSISSDSFTWKQIKQSNILSKVCNL